MWKKMAALIVALTIVISGMQGVTMNVSAQDVDKETDASYLLTEDAMIGYMENQTRGVYLASGYSAIKDGGTGKIIAGGGTDATTKCKVAVNVIVERLSGGNWIRVTSWTGTRENALSVISSQTLSVGTGYYYRVRCVHFAASDVSSSMTSSLWV